MIVHGVRVSLKQGDITKETVDVIVNSTNQALDLDTGNTTFLIIEYFAKIQ